MVRGHILGHLLVGRGLWRRGGRWWTRLLMAQHVTSVATTGRTNTGTKWQRKERRDPNGACGSSKKKSIQLRLSKGANLLCAFVLRPLQQNNKRRRALASKLGGWDPIRGIVVILRGTVERENPMNTTKRTVRRVQSVNICACKRVSRPSEGCVLRVLSCCLDKVICRGRVEMRSSITVRPRDPLRGACTGAMMIPTERPRSTPSLTPNSLRCRSQGS